MNARPKGSVRIGPISLFALIILLSLSVLSVLSASTAEATYSSAEKQARFISDTYANETSAQELLAHIDTSLSGVRTGSQDVEEFLDELPSSLPPESWVEERTIRAVFRQDTGRTLTIALSIRNNGSYTIDQWQARTEWIEQDETLWQG